MAAAHEARRQRHHRLAADLLWAALSPQSLRPQLLKGDRFHPRTFWLLNAPLLMKLSEIQIGKPVTLTDACSRLSSKGVIQGLPVRRGTLFYVPVLIGSQVRSLPIHRLQPD